MVYQTLLESKKPLMAKRIAYNIYHKYNGYRMSRFVVRDIIWKQLRDYIVYDDTNYTYTVKTPKQRKEAAKKKINYDSLLTPLIYNIPTIEKIIINYELYKVDFNNSLNFNLPNDYRKIKRNTWSSLYESLKKHSKEFGKLNKNDSFYILKENLNNPYYYYSLLIDTSKSENNIYFENNKFQRIFDEITRDNLITKAEENYLIEKGKELSIDIEFIEKAIKSLDFKAYKSFKLLIDEICEDGIISHAEREYIEEKAFQYNVDKELLNKMIEAGIKKIKFINNYCLSTLFYSYLKHLFLCIALKIDIDNEFYELHDEISDINQYLNDEISIMVQEIKLKLKDDFMVELNKFNIDEFLEKIGVQTLSHEDAIKQLNDNNEAENHKDSDKEIIAIKNKFKIRQNTLNKLRINNTEFVIKKAKLHFHPIFSYEFKRETGENIIIINVAHKLYNKESENLIIKIAASMHYTRLSMTDPNTTKYIERISNNLELIENEY